MPEIKQVKSDRQVPYWHRKVSRSRTTRTIAVGGILPPDWLIVRIRVMKLVERTCLLEVTKLD